MSIHADESKHISLSLNEIERLCPVAKALSSPLRVRMLTLLSSRSMNVNEIADALSMPVSTAADLISFFRQQFQKSSEIICL